MMAKHRGMWLCLTGLLMVLIMAPAAGAQDARVIVREENLRATPNGERLGTLLNSVRFYASDREGSWYWGERDFFIWKESVQIDGATGTVLAAVENIRTGPPDRVKIGTLVQGTTFAVTGVDDKWVEGKIEFWIWAPSVTEVIEGNQLEGIKYYYRALQHYDRGTLGRALVNAQKSVEYEPANARAWFLIGLIHKSRGDTLEALTAYDRTIELNPDYAEAYVNKGNIYLMLGESDTAIYFYQQAIQHNQELVQAYFNMAETYYALGQDTEAVFWYSRLVEVKPDYFMPYYNIACIYALAGNRDAALEWFTRAAPLMERVNLRNAMVDDDLLLLRDDERFLAVIRNADAALNDEGNAE